MAIRVIIMRSCLGHVHLVTVTENIALQVKSSPRPDSAMVGLHAAVCLCITLESFQNDPLQAANVHVNANAPLQPRQSVASVFMLSFHVAALITPQQPQQQQRLLLP